MRFLILKFFNISSSLPFKSFWRQCKMSNDTNRLGVRSQQVVLEHNLLSENLSSLGIPCWYWGTSEQRNSSLRWINQNTQTKINLDKFLSNRTRDHYPASIVQDYWYTMCRWILFMYSSTFVVITSFTKQFTLTTDNRLRNKSLFPYPNLNISLNSRV